MSAAVIPALPLPIRSLRWLEPCALLLTVPAFYMEMLLSTRSLWPALAYVLAALALGLGRRYLPQLHRPAPMQPLSLVLMVGFMLSAALPPSTDSPRLLTLRMITAVLTLVYLVWSMQHLLRRGSLPMLLALAFGLLLLCGAGFWWLEPRVEHLGDGLWLAFTTAATVGFGDIVPSTPASKIFSVFVVLLGYGVLSLVTAAIAAMWVENNEQRLEENILRDLHLQVRLLHEEVRLLRLQLPPSPDPATPVVSPATTTAAAESAATQSSPR